MFRELTGCQWGGYSYSIGEGNGIGVNIAIITGNFVDGIINRYIILSRMRAQGTVTGECTGSGDVQMQAWLQDLPRAKTIHGQKIGRVDVKAAGNAIREFALVAECRWPGGRVWRWVPRLLV